MRAPFLRGILTAAAAVIMATSCSSESGVDGDVDMTVWNLVTYVGPYSETGAGSKYVFQEINDSPVINLYCPDKTFKSIEKGQRIVLGYYPVDGDISASGEIDIFGALQVTQGALETEWKTEYDAWDRDAVYLYSTWRSGTYINFHVRLTYSEEPRTFCLAADPATLSSPVPDLYLVHIMASQTTNHDRIYYASFSIEELWQRDDVKGVNVHVANSNTDKQIFTFLKDI